MTMSYIELGQHRYNECLPLEHYVIRKYHLNLKVNFTEWWFDRLFLYGVEHWPVKYLEDACCLDKDIEMGILRWMC